MYHAQHGNVPGSMMFFTVHVPYTVLLQIVWRIRVPLNFLTNVQFPLGDSDDRKFTVSSCHCKRCVTTARVEPRKMQYMPECEALSPVNSSSSVFYIFTSRSKNYVEFGITDI